MSMRLFYNFCLKDIDPTDLESDILSGVRRSYFCNYEKIKDRITENSGETPCSYDFSIEKEKPMKWLVRNANGIKTQEVLLSDNGKYYIYFYEQQTLYKRLLFSKFHTLLKVEYFDMLTGTLRHTLEPRKAQNSLCIVHTVKTNPQPMPLFEEPEIDDPALRERMRTAFTDYTAVASTDMGIVRFLSDEQTKAFEALLAKFKEEAANVREESFVGDETPLLDKISAKDFNVKRNLSSMLDITNAMAFGYKEEPEESAVEAESEPLVQPDETPAEIAEPAAIADEPETTAVPEEPVTKPETAVETPAEPEAVEADDPDAEHVPAEPEAPAAEAEPASEPVPENRPDKSIMADGAIYSYYGDLDAQGNRSGYGRTLTEIGRTAYEGWYFNDKRSGKGSYYYKDGSLCYTGDWLENVRHGVGVGVSSHDGSIHAGNWQNNKPEGSGVRLTADGDIKFVCKELSDGQTVLMNYLPDDVMSIAKYDENGKKIGETSISLKEIIS